MSFCQAQNVKIIEEKLISSNINLPLYEPHFIIDPNNPDHFLVASILVEQWEEGGSTQGHIVLLQSWDKGKTWKETHFDKPNIASGYDPWLAMNKDGTVLLTSLNTFTNQPLLHMLAYVSLDAGKTWNMNPMDLGTSHDRQSIVVESFRQKFIIVSSRFNRNTSRNGTRGLSFTVLSRTGLLIESNWHEIFNANKDNGPPVITDDGKLFVPIIDYSLNNKLLNTRRNWIVTSNDLGRRLSAPTMVSEDGSFPYLILDTINNVKPKLHHIQTKGKFREYSGYTASTSEDNGYSWSDKVDITQYEGNEPYIRNATWTMNNSGIIGAFWFDRRATDGNKHDLYFTYSDDEAKSFKKPIRVSSKSSIPKPEKYMGDKRWPVGGDYFGVASSSDGRFHVVWADQRGEKSSLYFATIAIEK